MAKWLLKCASYKTPDDIFNAVLEGTKTIETRQRNPEGTKDYSNIQAGDTLIFKSPLSGRHIEKEASFVHVYGSVAEMAENEDQEKNFPGIGSKQNLLHFYDEVKRKWGRSYAQKLDKYGIVAIGFK